MTQTCEDPARAGDAAGPEECSFLEGENNTHITPTQRYLQAEYAPATAPLILDLQYANVELDLRICGVKAIQAATDLEMGEPDDIAERNIRVAINHLKDAAARFNQIKAAKCDCADSIIAEAVG